MCRGGNPPGFACFVKPLAHKFIPVPRYRWLLGFCKMNDGCPGMVVGTACYSCRAEAEEWSSLLKAGPPGGASWSSFCYLQFFWR